MMTSEPSISTQSPVSLPSILAPILKRSFNRSDSLSEMEAT